MKKKTRTTFHQGINLVNSSDEEQSINESRESIWQYLYYSILIHINIDGWLGNKNWIFLFSSNISYFYDVIRFNVVFPFHSFGNIWKKISLAGNGLVFIYTHIPTSCMYYNVKHHFPLNFFWVLSLYGITFQMLFLKISHSYS